MVASGFERVACHYSSTLLYRMPAATAKSTAPSVEETATAAQSPDLIAEPAAKAKTTKAKAAATTDSKPAVKAAKAKTAKAAVAKTTKAKTAVKTTKAKTTKAKTTKAKAAPTTDAKPAVKATKAKPAEDAAPAAAATSAVAVTTTVSKDGKAAKLPSIKIGPKGVYTEDSIRVYLQEIGRIRHWQHVRSQWRKMTRAGATIQGWKKFKAGF